MYEDVTHKLRKLPFISEIVRVSGTDGGKIYLVGGAVRDAATDVPRKGRGFTDLDLAVEGNPARVCAALAKRLDGHCFPLDRERGVWRAVSGSGSAHAFRVDIAAIIGGSIEEDLLQRDFTVNALAVELSDTFRKGDASLIDPLNGLRDIRNKTIRAARETLFDDDPLRLLRAPRFAETLQFRIEEKTGEWITGRAGNLTKVSGERIRDEIFLAFSAGRASRFLRRIRELGLLQVIIPGDHSIHTVSLAETLLRAPCRLYEGHEKRIRHTLSLTTEQGITVSSLFLLSALLLAVSRDSGKHITAICGRLKLSGRSAKVVESLTLYSRDLLSLNCMKEVSKRDIYAFFHKTGEFGPLACLLAVVETGTAVEHLVKAMLDYYFNEYSKISAPLLTGHDLIQQLVMKPGPRIGDILLRVEQERAEGIITNREEAIDYVETHLLAGSHHRGDP